MHDSRQSSPDKPPIVFFGSGPVAAKSLALLHASFSIEAIITKPATAAEMSRACPGVPVHTAYDRRSLDTLCAAVSFASSCAVLVDFGIIVSREVINRFPLGIVNSHFSLLPQWRGADPISFAILSGQEETGVSLMLLVEAMDEGPLLAQAVQPIPQGATTPQLTGLLIELSDAMLKTVLPAYLDGTAVPAPQEAASLLGNVPATYSRKLTKEDGILDWRKPAAQLECEVRAFIGWPKSRAMLAGKDVIITTAHATQPTHHTADEAAGSIFLSLGGGIGIACGEGALIIDRLKPAGKPEMSAAAFLAGHKHLLRR